MGKAKRNIIKIDEDKCNGCGVCVPGCKEGALQIIDGKARLVSDVYCDGLGACLGECPRGALTIEERTAEEFDEAAVEKHIKTVKEPKPLACGCPGTMAKSLKPKVKVEVKAEKGCPGQGISSELGQWPVQLALIPARAPYLQHADLVILADCTAVAYANLHHDFIRGRVVAMACPKLDDTGPYVEKLAEMIEVNDFRSVEVVMMEVPCCSSLMGVVQNAKAKADSQVRLKKTIINLEGNINEG
ncbi:MAG: 4Fe-4S binding protein [Deltaproteobacteria bacterium]|jgi:NAD-dependent dihydropyrimidine dehydrogenase PreA subunit|nr:4Fe-4S binding protein [Deltaproteobacteria bacterium]